MTRTAIVFIHGIRSKPRAWDKLVGLIEGDEELIATVELERFEYNSRLVGNRLLTSVPSYRTVADKLSTRFESYIEEYDRLVFVTHSQGGLVLQTFLSRMLAQGRGADLRRIQAIVLIACPNGGSGIFLNSRRLLGQILPNMQEQRLRPLDEEVADTHQHVAQSVDRATVSSSTECRIPIVAYAAESDAVVRRVSAYGSFRKTGVLPGTHKSVIRPESRSDPRYVDLRTELQRFLSMEPVAQDFGATLPTTQAPVRRPRTSSNLPRRPAEDSMIGREIEAQQLYEMLADPGVEVVLLDGVAGTGKSTLALSTCHDLLASETNPVEAVFWYSARSDALHQDEVVQSGLSADLDELTATIALTMDRRDLMHLSLTERASGIRAALAQVACVVVLDNFESVQDQRLLPYLRALPSSCTVLITSRRAIDAPARLHLAPLDEVAISAIARSQLGRREIPIDEATVSQIEQLSGGLPLAVIWLVGQMALGAQHVEPARRELHDDELLLYLFGGSMGNLDIANGPLTLAAVAFPTTSVPISVLETALLSLGLSRSLIEENLAELTRSNIVTFSHESSRYSVLPIVRRFLADEALPSAPASGMVLDIERAYASAWATHLSDRTGALWQGVYSVGDWDASRSDIINSLTSALLAVERQAQFLDAFYPFAITFGHFNEFLELTENFFDSNPIIQPDAVASLRARRSSIFLHAGILDKAESELSAAETAYASVGDPGYVLSNIVHFVRSIVAVTTGHVDAEATLQSAIAFEREHGEAWARIGFGGWLGLFLVKENRLTEADDLLRRLLSECRQLGDQRTTVFIQVGLARLHLAEGQFAEVIREAPEVLALASEFGEEHNHAHLHFAVAQAYFHSGDYSNAEYHASEAEKLYARIGATLDINRCAELKSEIV